MSAVAWTVSPTNVTVAGTLVTKTGGSGGSPDAFVTAADALIGAGELSFTLDVLGDMAIGLTQPGQTTFATLDFAFVPGPTIWEVYENGVFRASGAVADNDVLKIVVTDTTVEYFKNGASVRGPTAVTVTFPLVPHVLFWASGAAIRDATQTGAAPVVPQTYTALIASHAPEFVVLVEVQPMETLQSWTAAGGGLTNTWYSSYSTQIAADVVPGGIYRRLDFVRHNDTDLTSRASAALVNSNPGSYFHDTATNRIYVRISSGLTPDTAALIGVWFTLFFSTRTVTFTDQPVYWPIVSGTLPVLVSEMPDPLFGEQISDTGSVELANGDGLFDRLSRRYTWRNKKVTFKLGGVALSYADFVTVTSLRINGVSVDDSVMLINLEQAGQIFNRSLPWEQVMLGTLADCPLIPDETLASRIFYASTLPGGYTWINVYAVERVTGTRTLLVLTTDYTPAVFGYLTLSVGAAAAYPLTDYEFRADIQEFAYSPSSANAAGMVKALLLLCGVSLSDMDWPSFDLASYLNNDPVGIAIRPDMMVADILRQLEQSVLGQVYLTSDAKWAFRLLRPSGPADWTLTETDFASWTPSSDLMSVLNEVRVAYAKNYVTGEALEASSSRDAVRYGSETSDSHTVNSLLTGLDGVAASGLANHMRFLKEQPAARIRFEERGLSLMGARVGDMVAVTRSRAPNARTGRYDGHLLRLVRLEKALGPEIPIVRADLDDIAGQVDRIFRLTPAGVTLSWATASEADRAYYGFMSDANGYLSAADPLTRFAKVLW